MPEKTAFTAGYLGHTPEQLLAIADRMDALVVDIRWSPDSRVPGWRQSYLARTLGARYHYVRELGNVCYRVGPPVQIADLAAGLGILRELPSPLILLCACRDYETCHRRDVGEALRTEGWTVEELLWITEGIDG